MKTNTYKHVESMTGISVATLVRAKRKEKERNL
ncbi:hypothetical protein [Paraclostridium bifermentans]